MGKGKFGNILKIFMKETFAVAPSAKKGSDSGEFALGKGPRTGWVEEDFDLSVPEQSEEVLSQGTEFDPMDQAGGEFDPILERMDPVISRGLAEARSKRAETIPKKMVEPRKLLKPLSPLPKRDIKGSLPHFPGSKSHTAEQRRNETLARERITARSLKRPEEGSKKLPHFPGSTGYKAEQARLDEDHRQLVEDAIRRYPSAQKEQNEQSIEVTEKDFLLTNKLPSFPGSAAYKAEQARLDEDRRQLTEDAMKRYPSAQKEADAVRRSKRFPSINEAIARQKKTKDSKEEVIEVSDRDILPARLPHFPGSSSYKAEQARLEKDRRARLKEALPRGLPKMPKKQEVLVEDEGEELSDEYLKENMVEVLPSRLLQAVPPPVPKDKPRPVQRLFGFVKNFFTGDKKAA